MSKFFSYDPEQSEPLADPPFLAQASADDWVNVVAHCERRRFRAGDVVVVAGDIDRSLVIVLEGDLESVVDGRRGRQRLSPAPAGSIMGELGFLDGKPRSATVVAATDGELLRMSLPAFESLAAANPRLGRLILFDLARVLAGRLRALTDVVTGMR